MTVILPFGRVLSRPALPRTNQLLTRLASTSPFQRAPNSKSDNLTTSKPCHEYNDSRKSVFGFRGYATAASSKPAARPKAHTGRTAAKKPTAKRTAGQTQKKATPKKRSKAKSKAKPKSKAPARKKAVKKPLSAVALRRARTTKVNDLKSKAVLTEPKPLPATAYTLYFSQNQASGIKDRAERNAHIKRVAENYRSITPEEKEELNHQANQNKSKNDLEYKKWVQGFTPAQVKEANDARKALNQHRKTTEGRKPAHVKQIKDDRLVASPRNSYTYFYKERHASGDFKHMKVAEAAGLAGKEWKALSASERKPYEDQAQADKQRYFEEVRTVYQREPSVLRKKKQS